VVRHSFQRADNRGCGRYLLYLSQSEQDSAWEDGGGWYDDRLNACSFLLKLQLRRWVNRSWKASTLRWRVNAPGNFPEHWSISVGQRSAALPRR